MGVFLLCAAAECVLRRGRYRGRLRMTKGGDRINVTGVSICNKFVMLKLRPFPFSRGEKEGPARAAGGRMRV
jgi:hypothetical protein